MAVVITDAVQDRIDADRRETTSRLASQASHYVTEPDTITDGWIVRNPRIPARCEIVSPDGTCTCPQYRIWGRCRHASLVELRHGTAG